MEYVIDSSAESKKDAPLAVISWLLFLIYPLAGVCMALYLMPCSKYRFSLSLLAGLFGGLLGYTYLPSDAMDITRHFITFKLLLNVKSWDDFLLFETLSQKPDGLFDFLYWMIGHVSDSHQWVGFLSGFLFYFFSVLVLVVWHDVIRATRGEFLFLCGVFLALSCVYTFNGVRNGNAVVIFMYIVVLQAREYRARRLWWLVLPCIMHFSMYPVVALYLLAIKCRFRTAKKISVFLILLFPFFQMAASFLSDLLMGFGGTMANIGGKIDRYLSGEEGKGALMYMGSSLRYYVICTLTVLIPLLYSIYNSLYKKQTAVLQLFFRFSVLFYGYLVFSITTFVFARNILLLSYLLILWLSLVYKSGSVSVNSRKFVYGVLIVTFLSGLPSFITAKEYRVVNSKLFTSNIVTLFKVQTQITGYKYE